MIGLTVVNYGYPIAQLMVLKETNVPAVYVGAQPMSEQPLFSLRNPWFSASVGVTAGDRGACRVRRPDLAAAGAARPQTAAASGTRSAAPPACRAYRPQGTAIQPDFKTSNVGDDVGDADAARARYRSAAARRWRSAARSATGRRASATPIRRTSPGNSPP